MDHIHPTLKFTVILAGALVTTCACFYLMMFLITRELSDELQP